MPDTITPPAVRIDPERIGAMMEDLSAFGGGPDGSMTRLTLSRQDGAARDWLGRWFAANGFVQKIDAIGNQFGCVEIAGANAPTIMVGSHLDSQPNGGRFDGALGVVAACEAVRAVRDALAERGALAACNFTVANWTNEEGARFQPSLLGSSVFAGAAELDWALDRKDGNGLTVRDELAAIGYAGTDVVPHPAAFLELHIEGGPFLERAGRRFGAFTRFWGATKYRLAFLGLQAHTGPTPMAERHDAFLAAAEVTVGLKALSREHGLDLHTSVGRIEVFPNSPNTVPSEAVLFIELRSGAASILAKAEESLKAMIEAAAVSADVGYEIRSVDLRPAGTLDPGIVALAERVCARHDEEVLHLDTIGGHDTIALSAVCPALVMAVPSVNGVIHHPTEFTKAEDQAFGTQILAEMLEALAADGLSAIKTREPAK